MKILQKSKVKLIVLSILVAFTFFRCQKESYNAEEAEQTNGFGTTIDYISEVEVPEVIKTITSFTGSSSVSKTAFGKGISYNKAYIDINSILKVEDKDAIINYSFSITVENAPINEFYNLIVNEDSSGNLKVPYVSKYVVDDDALDVFLDNNKDFRYFKGKQFEMPFDSFFMDTDIFSRDNGTDDPCSESDINNTGYGGSGSFNDIPYDNLL